MGPVVVTLLVGGVIGGFVGGFASGETFSAMWAGVGAIATLGAALLLGWRFHVAEEKKKREELPPEIRGVFDRMLGVERDGSGRVVNDRNGVFTSATGARERPKRGG